MVVVADQSIVQKGERGGGWRGGIADGLDWDTGIMGLTPEERMVRFWRMEGGMEGVGGLTYRAEGWGMGD